MSGLYRNIANRELPTLLHVCFDGNNGDMEKAAWELETIDLMLGVIKMRSLINKHNGRKRHHYHQVLEAIITRKGGNR